METNYVRLPIQNSFNIRDLGGYPCADGSVTNWRAFLRADDISKLDENDISFLLDYGLTSVVDLRSEEECKANPSLFAGHPKVKLLHAPLMTDNIANVIEIVNNEPAGFIPAFYMGLTRQAHKAICDIFTFMSEQEGCTLFHCTAGKDRTGIIAMLLLGLAGVGRADIIANYEVTYTYIQDNPAFRLQSGIIAAELMYSKPEYIQPVIDYITGECSGFESYLLSAGLDSQTLMRLKKRLHS